MKEKNSNFFFLTCFFVDALNTNPGFKVSEIKDLKVNVFT